MSAVDPDDYLDPSGEPRPGAPLGMLLSAYAARAPERAALTVGETTLTRAERAAAATRRARQLADLGVGKHDRVVVALPNGRAFYEIVLAAWKLGAIPIHVSWRLTAPEFAEILALAEPRLVAGTAQAAEAAAAVDAIFLLDGVDPDPRLSPEPLPPKVGASWKISTSGGSTGRPKLVVDPKPGVWGEEKGAQNRRAGATIVNPGPLYHSAPFGQMIPALCQGAHVVEMGRFDPERWLHLVDHHRADWAYLVPTMMARIARLPAETLARYDISCIETLVHMAAPCPDWVKEFWIDHLGPDAIWEIYGGTERFGATVINGREWLDRPGSVGRPRTGNEIRILDEAGAPLAPGEIGEIYFRRPGGPDSTFRYIGAEARRRDDWASFGDLGWLDTDGYLYIADRRTDMIVSGGVNLYPAEIEAAIDLCAGVLGSVVVGVPDADLGQSPHAIVQVEPERLATIGEAEILGQLRDRLAVTKHPRSVEFTADPIRDDAGKIRRAAWREACVARMATPEA